MTRAVENKIPKLLFQLLSGAVVGAASIFALLQLGHGVADFNDPSRLAAAAIGVVFLLMGVFVGLGAIVPGIGARFLNVEDADELVEERKSIGPGAITCALTGIVILALSFAPGGVAAGAYTREATLAVVGIALAALVLVSVTTKRGMGELNRQLGVEASATAMNVSIVAFFAWAALAHLGYVEWMQPLGLVAALAWIQLGSVFWAVGKRGMLMPR